MYCAVLCFAVLCYAVPHCVSYAVLLCCVVLYPRMAFSHDLHQTRTRATETRKQWVGGKCGRLFIVIDAALGEKNVRNIIVKKSRPRYLYDQ